MPSPMARVPPTTTTAPSLVICVSSCARSSGGVGSRVAPPEAAARLEPLPRLQPAIRVAGGRLWCLGLDPAHALRARVVEAVDRADTGEHDVARAQGVLDPVELRLDLAREEEVRLLERVVVLLGAASGLVIHRE